MWVGAARGSAWRLALWEELLARGASPVAVGSCRSSMLRICPGRGCCWAVGMLDAVLVTMHVERGRQQYPSGMPGKREAAARPEA